MPEWSNAYSLALEVGVSIHFVAVVVAAEQKALIRLLESLPEPEPFLPFTLELCCAGQDAFVLFGWRAGSRRPDAWEAMGDLADELSLEFGRAVAAHYDGVACLRLAMLSHGGEPVRYYGEADEIWVPYDDAGGLAEGGPDSRETRSRTVWSAVASGAASTLRWRRPGSSVG
jgi:hypothetical protein